MKRDLDLVREILIAIESDPTPFGPKDLNLKDRDPVEVSYHVQIMDEAGLIEAMNLTSSSGYCWCPKSMTWTGHEFLDAARSDTVWNKAMTTLKEKAVSVPFEIVRAVVMKTCKDFFGVG